MEIEDIIEFYKNAPDFNEKVTTYQLEQLSGEVGSGIKYNCPSCSNLDTKGLCYKTEECGKIVNPIQFKSFYFISLYVFILLYFNCYSIFVEMLELYMFYLMVAKTCSLQFIM